MAIHEVTVYEAACDVCGNTPYDRGSEYAGWAQRDIALDEWFDSDYGIVLTDERVYCYGCIPAVICQFSDNRDGKHTPSDDGLTCAECDALLPAPSGVSS